MNEKELFSLLPVWAQKKLEMLKADEVTDLLLLDMLCEDRWFDHDAMAKPRADDMAKAVMGHMENQGIPTFRLGIFSMLAGEDLPQTDATLLAREILKTELFDSDEAPSTHYVISHEEWHALQSHARMLTQRK